MGEKKAHFFQHTDCEYFPCHETQHPEDFNCLFCYCPLYTLGDRCGGQFVYTYDGVKNCRNCLRPHGHDGIHLVKQHLSAIVRMAGKQDA